MINDATEQQQIVLVIVLVLNEAYVVHALCSSSPEHISPDCTEHVQLNSNYAVLIFHYTCPSWLARRATRRAALNNWTIMESRMTKACFLSKRVRRAIVATVLPSLRESNVVFTTIVVMLFFGAKVSFTREPTS